MSAEHTGPTGLPASSRGPSRSEVRRRRGEHRRRRRRRLAPAALVLLLLLASVIWLATTRSAPSSGGATTTLRSAPTTTSTTIPYLPAALHLPVTPALPGEGKWAVRDPWAGAPPSVLTASFRPDPSNPSIFAYVSWIRTASTQLALYPGYKGPGATTLSRGPEMVPPSARGHLLATFNSGFYEADAPGGFYTNGTLYFPMIAGRATLVQYTDGSVDVLDWTGGPKPPADVAMARQNLTLLVDHGQPGAGTSDGSLWGLTLHGVPLVWRTAVGVDAHGDLLYVAAPLQSAASLAGIMIQVGAVRAMQLDINPEWPIFVTYAGPGAAGPALVVPNPNQVADRFLYPSTKDFFAVYARTSKSAAIPW